MIPTIIFDLMRLTFSVKLDFSSFVLQIFRSLRHLYVRSLAMEEKASTGDVSVGVNSKK